MAEETAEKTGEANGLISRLFIYGPRGPTYLTTGAFSSHQRERNREKDASISPPLSPKRPPERERTSAGISFSSPVPVSKTTGLHGPFASSKGICSSLSGNMVVSLSSTSKAVRLTLSSGTPPFGVLFPSFSKARRPHAGRKISDWRIRSGRLCASSTMRIRPSRDVPSLLRNDSRSPSENIWL